MILLPNQAGHGGDSFKRQQESWRHAYAQAQLLRDRFPSIEQLVAEVTFMDSKRLGHYSAQMHRFSPAAKAFFAIPCPRTLCLEGGFDLDALIERLIAAGKTAGAGTLECGGRIGGARSQDTSCCLRLSYQVRAEYYAAAPRQPEGRRSG